MKIFFENRLLDESIHFVYENDTLYLSPCNDSLSFFSMFIARNSINYTHTHAYMYTYPYTHTRVHTHTYIQESIRYGFCLSPISPNKKVQKQKTENRFLSVFNKSAHAHRNRSRKILLFISLFIGITFRLVRNTYILGCLCKKYCLAKLQIISHPTVKTKCYWFYSFTQRRIQRIIGSTRLSKGEAKESLVLFVCARVKPKNHWFYSSAQERSQRIIGSTRLRKSESKRIIGSIRSRESEAKESWVLLACAREKPKNHWFYLSAQGRSQRIIGSIRLRKGEAQNIITTIYVPKGEDKIPSKLKIN